MLRFPQAGYSGAKQASEIGRLVRLYETSPEAKIAHSVICTEILRHPLRLKDDGEVPLWADRTVRDAVRATMISGYFVFRVARSRIIVLPPESVTLIPPKSPGGMPGVELNRRFDGVFDARRPRLNPVIFRLPRFRSGDTACIDSPLADAREQLVLLMQVHRTWKMRDAQNSRHTGYCTVALENQRGHTRPWFAGSESVGAHLDTKQDFDMLIQDRAETIRALDENTSLAREKRPVVLEVAGVEEDDSEERRGMEHTEHRVTDGMSFAESRPLTADSTFEGFVRNVRRDALTLLGLPPQALGENVNTERMASSNALTEAAMNIFRHKAKRYRRIIGAILETCNVEFETCLSQHDIERLEAVLKPDVVSKMYACVYDVPEDWIDKARLRQRAQILNGAEKAAGTAKVAGVKAGAALPETLQQLERRNEERERPRPKTALEEDTSARKRKRRAEEPVN